MHIGNARKTAELGMSHSSAAHRLRKNYMLNLLVRLGEDICCRCGLKITDAKDLSLDHVKPWLGERIELFWDLENIKPSHLGCNARAIRPNMRKFLQKGHIPANSIWPKAPEGTKWCYVCKDFLYLGVFSKDKGKRDGLSAECCPCRSKKRSKGIKKSKYQNASASETLDGTAL